MCCRSLLEMQGSFLSSSSTLGAGLDLMDQSVDALVSNTHELDAEEAELRAQLQAQACKIHYVLC